MDKLTTYRELIKRILAEEARYSLPFGETETAIITDEQHDHYQLMYLGWNHPRRIHSLILHIRLHNDKIWIEHDGTEEGVANILVEAGVPREDIVLAFHSPQKRPYTGFAVA